MDRLCMFLLHFDEASNATDLMGSAGVIEEYLFLNVCRTISRSSFTEVLQSTLTITWMVTLFSLR